MGEPLVVAFYLPQYHPIPENDEAWGVGFTDWFNVVRGRPFVRGHYQPHLPGELGFYDLRVHETRRAQAQLAADHRIDAFCYYHYWFEGRTPLSGPLDGLLMQPDPSLPFAICWANESWTRSWDGRSSDVIVPQRHSPEDDVAHIRYLLPALADRRYLCIDGRPLILVYRAALLPDPRRTADCWRTEMVRAGLPEPYLCRVENFAEERTDPRPLGFDAGVEFAPDFHCLGPRLGSRVIRKVAAFAGVRRGVDRHQFHRYDDLVSNMSAKAQPAYPWHRCVTPSWDNTPRRKDSAIALVGATPAKYERWLRGVLGEARTTGNRLVFVNAWNEWAEGAHLEPDARYGRAYLEATRRAVGDASSNDAQSAT